MATLQGTATVGLEIGDALNDIDVVIVAVGGGGLIGGVGSALKAMKPGIQVIGVEPEGACGMTQSLERGEPLESVAVKTIADSMGAPLHCVESFAICQRVINRMVLVNDDGLCQACRRFGDRCINRPTRRQLAWAAHHSTAVWEQH